MKNDRESGESLAYFFEDVETERGVKYQYRLTSLRTVGGTLYESLPSAAKTIPPPFARPRIKSLKTSSRGVNTLKWGSVSKASGYKVYRRVKNGSKWSSWRLIKTTNTLSYRDVKARSGKTYQYRVRAYRTYHKNTFNGTYSVKKSIKTI